MHVAAANRDALLHCLDHEVVQHFASGLDLWQARVSPVLALNELQELN